MSNPDDSRDLERMLEEYRRYREYVSERAPWLLDELERGFHIEQEAEALVSALRNTREETREDLQRLFARLAHAAAICACELSSEGVPVFDAEREQRWDLLANLLFSASRWSTRPQDLTEQASGGGPEPLLELFRRFEVSER